MRNLLALVASGLIVAALSVGVVSPASADQGGLSGTWTSIDNDGSHQTLEIRGSGRGGTYAMKLFDESATAACGGRPAQLAGPGSVSGNDLLVTGALVCLAGGNPLTGRITVAFTYSPGADTLADEFGVVWHRS
jgi:Flp pilus assembly pilin Flp